MRFSHLLSTAVLIAGASIPAFGDVIYLQDAGGNALTFEGVPVTQATFDDTVLATGTAALADDNTGNNQSMQIRTTGSGLVYWAAIAVKDMFAHVETAAGGVPVTITSATLHLASGGTNQGPSYTVNVRRITTDWLANPAGDNETRASGNQRNGNAGNPVTGGDPWPGGSGNFGAASFTATNAQLGVPFANTVFGAYIGIDVTGIVTDMFDLGVNYGFVVSTPIQQDGFLNIRSSEDEIELNEENELVTFRPVIEINYELVPEPASLSLLMLGAAAMIRRRS